MIENITPIDSLVSEGQKLDYICKTVDTISDNTAAFDGFFGFSTINTLFAFGASIVTIAGIEHFLGVLQTPDYQGVAEENRARSHPPFPCEQCDNRDNTFENRGHAGYIPSY